MAGIPLGLQRAFETENCVLFIGAGIGSHLKTQQKDSAPDGTELCRRLITKFSIETEGQVDLAKIAEIVEIRHGRKELETFIRKQLAELTPDETFLWITSVRWKAIYTTNYDNCIERAYQIASNPKQNPVPISSSADVRAMSAEVEVPINHIHGYLYSEGNTNIVITQSDYAKFSEKRRMLFESLKRELASSTFLYIGYSNADPNWQMLLQETINEFMPSKLPQSYRIDPNAKTLDEEILNSKNINTLKCTFSEFVDSIKIITSAIDSTSTTISAFKKIVPSDLLPIYDKNPTPLIRLLKSWEYINQAAYDASPNLNDFLKGDTPNWALISHSKYFERDVQGDLYDEILEFATTTKPGPSVCILLGSAGYGTTTLLKVIAVETVKEKAGAVFMLRQNAKICEGDIEYASTLFQNVYFIIDNAADSTTELVASIDLLKQTKKRAFFLLGDRLNEWHQRFNRPKGKEVLIEPLSDYEIDNLLDFLTENNALNKLADFPRDHQFNIIKERFQKELIVTLREATENNNFDAIIESEYRGIGDDFSRQFYLYVCFFYQHGALIRDTLLSELLGKEIQEIYQQTQNATEGIVVFDCIDETRGHYIGRARHHKIAAVVWERCGEQAQKENIILNVIKLLNLNYGVDVRAFELFIKSDKIVDGLHRLDDKMRYFDNAIKKDPTSPYVYQHYARMLTRAGQQNTALLRINEAIKINSRIRVLHHTKGKILTDLCISSETLDIGRKYLTQAEECFRTGISMSNKDEFCFESLADLYFEWARKVNNQDVAEANEYLSKAEETISAGLRTVQNRESLLVLSSKILRYFGDTPNSINALKQAVREQPNSPVARYLLSRIYRNQGNSQIAKTFIEPIIGTNNDDPRMFIEYSLALLEIGEEYKKIISILELGTLYGLSNPEFIALYGGLLYLDGEFTKAENVFQNAIKQNMPIDEVFKIYFTPFNKQDHAKPIIMNATVIVVKPGYAFLKPDNYPQIICPASKYAGIILKKEMRVECKLAFNARGPIALYPKSLEM